MSEVVRQKLIELVANIGPDLGTDARRCEAFLNDLCRAQYKREIFVIVGAIRERVPSDFRGSDTGVPIDVLVGRLVVSGCATNGNGPTENQTTGAGLGAIFGAVLGAAVSKNKAQGALIGALTGGLLGYGIGSYLDEHEKRQLAEASYQAAAEASTGERVNWGAQVEEQSPELAQPGPTPYHRKGTKAKTSKSRPAISTAQNSASGWVIPLNDPYVVASGQTCRDLQQVANKNGRTYSQKVRACNAGSGWVVPSV